MCPAVILGAVLLFWAVPNLAFLLLAVRYLTKFNRGKVKSNVTGVKSPYSTDKIVQRILIAVALVALVALSAMLIVLTGVVAWHSHNLQTRWSGRATFLPGIVGTRVTITRNADAVPRITVTDMQQQQQDSAATANDDSNDSIDSNKNNAESSKADLAFGQAWVHMSDRQYQIDLYHRIATGRLSTLVGERGLRSDMFMRSLDLKRHAQQALDSGQLSASTVQWLRSYAAGVNAYVRHRSSTVPWEMWLEGHRFNDGHDWTPADSLALLQLWQWSLSSNYAAELARLRLLVHRRLTYARTVQLDGGWMHGTLANMTRLASFKLADVGINSEHEAAPHIAEEQGIMQRERQFWDDYQRLVLGITPAAAAAGGDGAPLEEGAVDGKLSAEAEADTIEDLVEQRIDPTTAFFGSVFKSFGWAWVGTPDVTTGGFAINVAELEGRLSMPNMMHLCHLRLEPEENSGGGTGSGRIAKEVTGASLPGVPGVIMGRTGAFSWSLVPSNADNTDLFILRDEDGGKGYRKGAQVLQYETREEEIVVRGRKEPVTFVVRDSVHGPVLDAAFLPFNMTAGFSVALQWAPHHMVDLDNRKRHDRTIEVFADVWTMSQVTHDEVGELFMDKFDAPPMGVFYTDAEMDYNAAFFYVGAVPIRPHSTGMVPVDGSGGSGDEFDWPIRVPAPEPKFNPGRKVPLTSDFHFSAGNRFVPRGFKFRYGYDFADSFRTLALRDTLAEHLADRPSDDWDFVRGTFSSTRNGMWHNSDPADFHFRRLLESLPEDRLTSSAARERRTRLLEQWDGRQEGRDAGLFMGWWYELSRLTQRETGVRHWNRPSSVLQILLHENGDPLCAAMVEEPATHSDCLQFAAQAFERAVRKYGGLKWGSSAPSVRVDHELYRGGNFYSCACSRPSFSQGGGSAQSLSSFPDRGPGAKFVSRHGPVYRHVHNYNKYAEMRMVINGGQSGHPWEKGLYDGYRGKYLRHEFVDAALGGAFSAGRRDLVLSRGK